MFAAYYYRLVFDHKHSCNMRTIGKFEIKALSLNNFVFVFSKMQIMYGCCYMIVYEFVPLNLVQHKNQ